MFVVIVKQVLVRNKYVWDDDLFFKIWVKLFGILSNFSKLRKQS